MGQQRSARVLLWLIPLLLCLFPLAIVIALIAISHPFSISPTSPDCVDDESALLLASRDGDLQQVEALIADGAQLDQTDTNGNDAVYCAAFNGHTEVANRLIIAGADPDHANLSGETALHWSSRHGDLDLVTSLLSAGADPDATTDRGHTPLLWAALAGESDVVGALLEEGADPNLAGEAYSFEVLAYLPSPVDPTTTSIMLTGNDLPGCISLDEPMASVTPLDAAVAAEKPGIVAGLLMAGAEPDSTVYGCTPLHIASWLCDSDLVALLLMGGASGRADEPAGSSALDLAEASGCAEVAQLLRSADGPDSG